MSAPRSSAIRCFSCSDSGTSPLTICCANPSMIAVLPTPGSPISTRLFLVRRDSTCITRRISSSRPITGSSPPLARLLGEVAGEALERLVLLLGLLVDDAMRAAHPLEGRQQVLAVDPRGRQELARGRALLVREREQQVLGRDVCVAQRFRLLVGAVGRLRQLARQGGLPGAARLLGEAVDLALGLGRELEIGRA